MKERKMLSQKTGGLNDKSARRRRRRTTTTTTTEDREREKSLKRKRKQKTNHGRCEKRKKVIMVPAFPPLLPLAFSRG